MSVSPADPDSAEIPASWTDPQSDEPYTNTEWQSLNEAIHSHDEAAGSVVMRWVASDLSIPLSIIAEEGTGRDAVRLAVRGLRKVRQRLINQTPQREDAV